MNARRKFIGGAEKSLKWSERKKDSIPRSPDAYNIRKQFQQEYLEIQKFNSIHKLVSPERAKLPSLKNSWLKSRDISHLKDIKQETTSVFASLPTDIDSLKKFNRDPSNVQRAQKENELPMELENVEKIMLGNPSGRQEIENLNRWFVLMKEKYIENPNDTDEYFQNCSEIYSSCIKEIIRQVAVHCYDRGRLLKEVLNRKDSLLLGRQKKQSEDADQIVQNLNSQLDTVRNERNQTVEDYERKTLALSNKVSECIQEMNKQKEIIYSLKNTVQQRTDTYFDLENNFQKKKRAVDLLVKSLEESHIKVPPKILSLIQESSEVSLGLFSKNIEQDPDMNLVQREDKETQTNLKALKTRYTVKYQPIELKRKLQHSFDFIEELSDYEIEDHFNSLVDIDTDLSYYSKPQIEMMSNQLITQDLFTVYENEIQQSFAEESAQFSWKPGHQIRGVKDKDSETEFQQTGQEVETSFEGYSDFKFEEDGEENESFEDIFEDNRMSPMKTKKIELLRSNTERIIRSPECLSKRLKLLPKKSQRFTARPPKRVTKFKEFNWHKRRDSTSNQRKMSEVNILLHNLFRKKLESLQKRGNISIRMLNRFISNVYLACMGKNKNGDGDLLIEIMYDEIAFRYGFKTVADRKFVEMICSLLRFHKGKRKMFLKFIGAGEKIGTNNYSRFSLRLFLAMHHYLLNAKIGINVHRSEHSDVVLLPALRALECLKEKVEPVLGKSEINRLLNWVDSNSIPDPKKINQNGVINMDKFLFQVIETYELHQLSLYDGLFTLFQALMTDESHITPVEFEMLLRFLKHSNSVKREEDYDTEFIPELESYTFEQLFVTCIEKNIVKLKDIKNAIREHQDPETLVKTEKDHLYALLDSFQGNDIRCRTLKYELFKDRLDSLEQSIGEIKDNFVSIGWRIYSLEIVRVHDHIALK